MDTKTTTPFRYIGRVTYSSKQSKGGSTHTENKTHGLHSPRRSLCDKQLMLPYRLRLPDITRIYNIIIYNNLKVVIEFTCQYHKNVITKTP